MLFPELLEVLDPEPHSAPLNMAIDEVLLREVALPALRVYRWREAALSFGYFGRIAEVESVAAGRPMVRRWTGGGIVEHGEDVTYTLLVPRDHPFVRHTAPESYRLIHEAIAALLTGEGIASRVTPVAAVRCSGECFANPVQYDLLTGEVKIAGAAQRRTRWGLIHQGSIRMNTPAKRLRENMAGAFGQEVSPLPFTAKAHDAARALAGSKYGTSAWLRKF